MIEQQNYAKFDSRIAEENVMMNQSMDWDYSAPTSGLNNSGSMIESISYLLVNILDFVLASFITILGIFAIFFFLYIIISLATRGGETTTNELKSFAKWQAEKFGKSFSNIGVFFKKIFLFFWDRKSLSFLIIIILVVISFLLDVINGGSKLIRLTKIEAGYVGVDLKNQEILNPGYHLYLPLKTTFFLSPTTDFDFEIAEVTAYDSDNLGLALDCRVWFKIDEEKRLSLYDNFGPKNIMQISSDVVMPKLLKNIKGVIGDYSFKDISDKHNEIKEKTLTEVNKELNQIGIELKDLDILDIRLPESYILSQEELLKAENERKLAEARLEAQKKEDERKLIQAENTKKVKVIEAEGIAEYNRIINSEELTEKMVEMKKLENETLKITKWNGVLPTSTCSGDNFLK